MGTAEDFDDMMSDAAKEAIKLAGVYRSALVGVVRAFAARSQYSGGGVPAEVIASKEQETVDRRQATADALRALELPDPCPVDKLR